MPHILLSSSVFQTVEYHSLGRCYEQDLKLTIKKKIRTRYGCYRNSNIFTKRPFRIQKIVF